jgi:hypothetical protein
MQAVGSPGSPSRPSAPSQRSAGRASTGAATSSTPRRSSIGSSTSWVSRTRPSSGTSAQRTQPDQRRCRTEPRPRTSLLRAARSWSGSCRSFSRPQLSLSVVTPLMPYRASRPSATRQMAVPPPFELASRPSRQPRADLVVHDPPRNDRACGGLNLGAQSSLLSCPRTCPRRRPRPRGRQGSKCKAK